jgi:hypothetical protein
MVLKGLRFAEIHRLSPIETSPDLSEWKFWVVIKNHQRKEAISIFSAQDAHLDILSMLTELRERIREKNREALDKYNTFWFIETAKDLRPMTYNELRAAAAQVLESAGIEDHQPYHIKHATLTFLSRQGVTPEEITAFARHNYGSNAANTFYISWDNGRKLAKKIAEVPGGTQSLELSQLDIQYINCSGKVSVN